MSSAANRHCSAHAKPRCSFLDLQPRLSNQEIGDQLAVTIGTIKGHLVHIYRKLNVRNRTGAVAKARQMGLLK